MDVIVTGKSPRDVLRGTRRRGDAVSGGSKGICAAVRIGAPIRTRNIHFPPLDFPFSSVFRPASVSISNVRLWGWPSMRNAPAQRMPFPDISASLPSALKRRIRASWPRILDFKTTISPSAPAPVWRSRILRANRTRPEGRSPARTTSQSFPCPWYLTKGITLVINEGRRSTAVTFSAAGKF